MTDPADRSIPYMTGEEAEDEMSGWLNQYDKIYEEKVGEEILLEKLESQFHVSYMMFFPPNSLQTNNMQARKLD